MCEECRVRRIAVQKAVTDALANAMPTIEGQSFVRSVVEMSTEVLEDKINMPELARRATRLAEGTQTSVIETAVEVFGSVEALGELHCNSLTRELLARYNNGDRSMKQHVQDAIAEGSRAAEDETTVVIVQGKPYAPLSRDTTGRPIMPPSKDVQ